MKGHLRIVVYVAVVILLLQFPVAGVAETEGNCTICHQFPGIGRFNKTESDPDNTDKLIYYINNDIFETSYHGKLRCKSCHTEVSKYPHTDIPKVDCATDCHIRDPSVNKAFSHKKIVDDFTKSAHGEDGSNGKDKTDLPVCKDCHNNKPYHATVEQRIESKEFLRVCNECHESKAWTARFYEHMLYRSVKRRPSREVIKLCSRCHMDPELMDKHDLDVIVGFKETFHAKAISYGDEDVANCLNCHAPYQLGYSPHRIVSGQNEESPVHPDKKVTTCRQAGCHTKATVQFGRGGRVHPSPGAVQLVGRVTDAERTDEKQLLEDTLFEAKVIGWIVLFYKILIAAVIGGFIVHRSMDIYANRRQRRMAKAST